MTTGISSLPSSFLQSSTSYDNLIREIMLKSISNNLSSTQNENIVYQYVITLPCREQSSFPSGAPVVDSTFSSQKLSYCYISYKQISNLSSSKNSRKNSSQQQAFILISSYPIPYLAYRVLNVIESAHATRMARLESKSSPRLSDEIYLDELLKLFTRAYSQVASWPSFALSRREDGTFGLDVMLPFFEQNLFYKISIPSTVSGIDLNDMDAPSSSAGVPLQAELSHNLLSLGSSLLFSGKSNLISIFGPCGFIPHLWTIWELLVQGADFIVCGKDPQSVCEVRTSFNLVYFVLIMSDSLSSLPACLSTLNSCDHSSRVVRISWLFGETLRLS
jgi:hypothetical protein